MTTTLKSKETGIEVGDAGIHATKKMDATNQVAIGLIMTLATLIGVWGLACLFGGLAESGNPINMVRLWISAITGM